MIKNIFFFSLFFLFVSCEKYSLHCSFSGKQKNYISELPDFDKIEINPLIKLIIYDDDHNEINIEADESIFKNISYEIKNQTLIITNNTNCIKKKSEAVAKIRLKVNNISKIIANTDMDISSGNILHFDKLKLICENNSEGKNNITDFHLQVQINQLDIIANGRSIFNIQGNVTNLFVGFYGVSSIFNGKKLYANHINIFQRSSNDMHLFPIDDISGELYGYGNVYIYHQPSIININNYGFGHLYLVN